MQDHFASFVLFKHKGKVAVFLFFLKKPLFCTFLHTDESEPDILCVAATYCLFRELTVGSAL